MALEQALADVRRRWGHGSIVRLDGGQGTADGGNLPLSVGGRPAAAVKKRRVEQEVPPWWPRAVGEVTVRPRLVEITGAAGEGRLTLALAWLAAARPALAAVIDTADTAPAAPATRAEHAAHSEHAGHTAATARYAFYPPAAVAAGVDLSRLLIVRPPGEWRAAPLALDAVVALLRSEAFDVVLCPLPAGTRLGLTFGGKLATLAARAGTSLVLLTEPAGRDSESARAGASVLQAFADYRVRLVRRRWLWADGELAGMRLRVVTERARASALGDEARYGSGAETGPSGGAGSFSGERPQHELTFRLHRLPVPGPVLHLERATRIDRPPEGADRERFAAVAVGRR